MADTTTVPTELLQRVIDALVQVTHYADNGKPVYPLDMERDALITEIRAELQPATN